MKQSLAVPSPRRPGTQRLQGVTHSHAVPVVCRLRRYDRFHECDTLDSSTMPIGPVEAESRTPVMDDEGDPIVHIEGLEQSVEVAAVFDEAVELGAPPVVLDSPMARPGRDQRQVEAIAGGQASPRSTHEVGLPCSSTMESAVSHFNIRHLAAQHAPPIFWYGNAAEMMFVTFVSPMVVTGA